MKINIKLDSIITINNCYISGNEHEFVCVVENELKLFTKSDSEDRFDYFVSVNFPLSLCFIQFILA